MVAYYSSEETPGLFCRKEFMSGCFWSRAACPVLFLGMSKASSGRMKSGVMVLGAEPRAEEWRSQ